MIPFNSVASLAIRTTFQTRQPIKLVKKHISENRSFATPQTSACPHSLCSFPQPLINSYHADTRGDRFSIRVTRGPAAPARAVTMTVTRRKPSLPVRAGDRGPTAAGPDQSGTGIPQPPAGFSAAPASPPGTGRYRAAGQRVAPAVQGGGNPPGLRPAARPVMGPAGGGGATHGGEGRPVDG